MKWGQLPVQLMLDDHDIHVICKQHRVENEDIEWLSDEEKQRVHKMLHPAVKRQFINSRILLRKILSKYLDCQPQEVLIANDTQGKPYLSSRDLQFNLAHSQDMSAIVISKHHLVGIDIESVSRDVNVNQLIQYLFADDEQAYVKQAKNQQSAFFYLWTAKEALAKAEGRGLRRELKQVSIFSDGVKYQENIYQITHLPKYQDHQLCVAYDSDEPLVFRLYSD